MGRYLINSYNSADVFYLIQEVNMKEMHGMKEWHKTALILTLGWFFPWGWFIIGAILFLNQSKHCGTCDSHLYSNSRWTDICKNKKCPIGKLCLKALKKEEEDL